MTKFASALVVLTLVATPAIARDNFAWRCGEAGETLVIASIPREPDADPEKTMNVAVAGPKKDLDVVTIKLLPGGEPLGAFFNGQACKRVPDE